MGKVIKSSALFILFALGLTGVWFAFTMDRFFPNNGLFPKALNLDGPTGLILLISFLAAIGLCLSTSNPKVPWRTPFGWALAVLYLIAAYLGFLSLDRVFALTKDLPIDVVAAFVVFLYGIAGYTCVISPDERVVST